MDETTLIRTGRHCVFELHVHLVFVTKYRRHVFTDDVLTAMEKIIGEVCEKMESTLVEFNGEGDHIHCMITYPPKLSVAKLVNSLKGASSRRIRRVFPSMKKRYWKDVLWSRSYFAASCGGAPLDIIRSYIEDQRRPA
ncbi:MAG: IS200/IS605 family transposase [Chitinivibrionales bacterium]|nr:IS200/IS605 family transposase [Chitinivibrionales bacterium]